MGRNCKGATARYCPPTKLIILRMYMYVQTITPEFLNSKRKEAALAGPVKITFLLLIATHDDFV